MFKVNLMLQGGLSVSCVSELQATELYLPVRKTPNNKKSMSMCILKQTA